MAKKSQAGRTTSARRPAATAAPRRSQATLVEAAGTENVNSAATAVVVPPATPKTVPTAARNIPTKTAAPSSAARAEAAVRRGKTTARGPSQMTSRRTLITAEHYQYVGRELRTIAIIAVLMFIFMVILHFVLPA